MTSRTWVFIAGKPFLPDAPDPLAGLSQAPGGGSAGLGGTEQAVIHLTSALAALGDRVTVAGGAHTTRMLNGVAWRPAAPPLADMPAADMPDADVHVAINNAALLPAEATRPAVWFHNEVSLIKEIRRRRLPALLRHRPAAIFIGTEQARSASTLLPFRSRKIIPYGLSEAILCAPAAADPPPPHAMFTSQAYRGLREIIAMWQAHIAPAIPAATLTAHIADKDVPTYRAMVTHPGITIAPRIGNDAVLQSLRKTRVLLAPGHISETFCLAAAEAIAMGVPVVTLGIGSLKERVRDQIDGHICRDYAGMAQAIHRILLDDAHWRGLHGNGIATRRGQGWPEIARKWQAAIKSL